VTWTHVDVAILNELVADARLTVSELAVRVGIARNTAQARLDRLYAAGVLGRNARGIALRPLGFPITAVVSVELRHSQVEEAVTALVDNAAVLEVEEVAGTADLLVRVAARNTDDLQDVVHSLLATPGVARTTTQVVLTARVPYRVGPLLATLVDHDT
jgi:DNA-binding Lrp family transcriptional regulator